MNPGAWTGKPEKPLTSIQRERERKRQRLGRSRSPIKDIEAVFVTRL